MVIFCIVVQPYLILVSSPGHGLQRSLLLLGNSLLYNLTGHSSQLILHT